MSERDDPVDEPTAATRREGQAAPRARPVERLARGTAVGRYLVIDVLGAGGMGVVYAAFDPELDRKVAIKLLQGKAEGGTDQAWLLREAQAMARLQHPNVIAVHDVGTLPGHRVFVAMEYIDGVTLRHWLKGQERPWREVLPVMLAAGAGLAAAHAAGLVHRDFKPDNVLVGSDRRVRVLDFGLARLHTEDEPPAQRTSDLQISLRSPLSETLTTAGTVMGTPEYMAPELYEGMPADARSDQFSFGVALYEALFWTRPYVKGAPRITPKPPPANGVPAHVQRAALRAVAAKRDERFPSMDALLAELSADGGGRRRGVIAAGAVAGLGAAVAAAFVLTRTPSRSQLCAGADRRLAGVWDEPARAAVRDAFAASGAPFATQAFAGLERALDGYAGRWTAASTASCQATRIHGEQTEEVLSLRQACLDQRLAELGALTDLLRKADADLVARGDKVVFGLEPVSRCADVAALRAPGRPPTEPRATLEELSRQLAASKAALLAGRPTPSIEAARRAAALADEVKYPPLRAEARLVEGAALTNLGKSDEASAAFAEAAFDALAASRHDVAAASAQAAALIAAQRAVGEATIWVRLARAEAARVPQDLGLALNQRAIEGVVAGAAGDMTAAVAALEDALATAERAFGPDSPALWSQEDAIAVTYAKSGAYDKARPHYERAIALREASVGPDHPDIAVLLTNLGPCYTHAGEPARARASYERALAIREKLEGPNNPTLVLTLNNMADGMIRSGDPTGALLYIDRAKQIATARLGDKNPITHVVGTTRAEALVALGRLDEARTEYDAVLAVEAETRSMFLGATLTSRTAMAVEGKAWADAVFYGQRAVAALEDAGGKDSPALVQALVVLARAHAALGRPAVARPLLERALAIGERAQLADADLAPARALLDELGYPARR